MPSLAGTFFNGVCLLAGQLKTLFIYLFEYANGTSKQTDGRQTVTLRTLLDAVSVTSGACRPPTSYNKFRCGTVQTMSPIVNECPNTIPSDNFTLPTKMQLTSCNTWRRKHSQNAIKSRVFYHTDDKFMRTCLPESGGRNVVDSINDAEQGGIGANSHVRSTEVVVNRTNDAHNVQVGTLVGILRRYLACQHNHAIQLHEVRESTAGVQTSTN